MARGSCPPGPFRFSRSSISGFPHGRDAFISAAGTNWAAMALALAPPPAPDVHQRRMPLAVSCAGGHRGVACRRRRGPLLPPSVRVQVRTVAIHEIQGPGSRSPLAGEVVTTRAVVTGRKSNGFFVQTLDDAVDADPRTSEGLFVFTGAAPAENLTPGTFVAVTAACSNTFGLRLVMRGQSCHRF